MPKNPMLVAQGYYRNYSPKARNNRSAKRILKGQVRRMFGRKGRS